MCVMDWRGRVLEYRRRRVCCFTHCPLIGDLSSVAKLQPAILFSHYSLYSSLLLSYLMAPTPHLLICNHSFLTSLSACDCWDVYSSVSALTAAFTFWSLRNHGAYRSVFFYLLSLLLVQCLGLYCDLNWFLLFVLIQWNRRSIFRT